MVAMAVMQHTIYRALDCFDLPTHWATIRKYYHTFYKTMYTKQIIWCYNSDPISVLPYQHNPNSSYASVRMRKRGIR